MIKRWPFILFFLLVLGVNFSYAQNSIQLNEGEILTSFGKKIQFLVDTNHSMSVQQAIESKKYQQMESAVPNLGVSTFVYWLKIRIKNDSKDPKLGVQIRLPTIDYVDFYQIDSAKKVIKSEFLGDRRPYNNRVFDNPFSTFLFSAFKDQETTILIKISGGEQLQVPLILSSKTNLEKKNSNSFLVFGIYVGVLFSMFIYNLFLYISTKDSTYLFYIVYIFFIGLLQANFQGIPFKYLWPDNVWLSTYAVYLLTPLGALSALEFMKKFLHTKEIIPKLHKTLNIFYIPYGIAIVVLIFNNLNLSYQLLQFTAMGIALYMLFVAFLCYRKGYRSAKFFLIAWVVFLLGLCIFVLKDYNILPYNSITYNMMPFGSALEATLLSFALADKINTYRKEKEFSQAEALRISQENERLIREQNIELEQKVNERTLALQESNQTLEMTLSDLKEAQSQLVDSEKMASLGQLTAGIAHEINNPINFVTSNIKPLELDINDLNEVITKYEKLDFSQDLEPQISSINAFKKQIDLGYVREEIKSLISGIGEGARRTAEIIRSLKNFSRLDENDTKPADLNEGLDSTLVLIKNNFPPYLEIIKDYGELPEVECMPGKINQVFMNLITNGLQAIKSKPEPSEREYITLKTWREADHVKISIKDTGTGMPEEVKQKIFEPFFTTKDVGEGTGLGLSIVFRIIENHHGSIDVITKLNQGTEFIITLPIYSR